MTETKLLRPTDEDARQLGRKLISEASWGAFAVLEPGTGHPMVSRVALAVDDQGCPFILVSNLAAHTGALVADTRCSLLVGEPGKGDPLAHPRMTLFCQAQKVEKGDDDRNGLREIYLKRHPKAALYIDFADFDFFRLGISKASLNGGFGKAYELSIQDLLPNLQ